MDHRQEGSKKSHDRVSMVVQTGENGSLGWGVGSGDGVRWSKKFKVLCLSETQKWLKIFRTLDLITSSTQEMSQLLDVQTPCPRAKAHKCFLSTTQGGGDM